MNCSPAKRIEKRGTKKGRIAKLELEAIGAHAGRFSEIDFLLRPSVSIICPFFKFIRWIM